MWGDAISWMVGRSFWGRVDCRKVLTWLFDWPDFLISNRAPPCSATGARIYEVTGSEQPRRRSLRAKCVGGSYVSAGGLRRAGRGTGARDGGPSAGYGGAAKVCAPARRRRR